MPTRRTYLPAILAFADWFKKYVTKNAATLQKYLGEGGFTVVVLVLDIIVVLASLLTGGHVEGDAWQDFTAVNTLTAQQINEIQGAFDKFYASNGITPGGG